MLIEINEAPILFTFDAKAGSISDVQDMLSAIYASATLAPTGADLDMVIESTTAADITAFCVSSETGFALHHHAEFSGYAIVMLDKGTIDIVADNSQIRVDDAHAAIVQGTFPRLGIYSPGLKMSGILFAGDLLERHLSHQIGRTIPGPIDFSSEIRMSASTPRVLQSLVHTLIASARGEAPLTGSPPVLKSLLCTLLDIAIHGLHHPYSDELRGLPKVRLAPRHVRRAIEFIQANLGQPLNINQIAAAASSTPRSLQDGFRKILNTTPVAFIRDLRLDAVRRDLLNPNDSASIADIALRWGFTHLGLFAARYRERFGELPSKTRQG